MQPHDAEADPAEQAASSTARASQPGRGEPLRCPGGGGAVRPACVAVGSRRRSLRPLRACDQVLARARRAAPSAATSKVGGIDVGGIALLDVRTLDRRSTHGRSPRAACPPSARTAGAYRGRADLPRRAWRRLKRVAAAAARCVEDGLARARSTAAAVALTRVFTHWSQLRVLRHHDHGRAHHGVAEAAELGADDRERRRPCSA